MERPLHWQLLWLIAHKLITLSSFKPLLPDASDLSHLEIGVIAVAQPLARAVECTTRLRQRKKFLFAVR